MWKKSKSRDSPLTALAVDVSIPMETELPSRKSMVASQACARTVGGPSLAPQKRSVSDVDSDSSKS